MGKISASWSNDFKAAPTGENIPAPQSPWDSVDPLGSGVTERVFASVNRSTVSEKDEGVGFVSGSELFIEIGVTSLEISNLGINRD